MGTEAMSFAVLSEKSYQNILFARSACERMPSKDGQPMIEPKEVSHSESEDYEIVQTAEIQLYNRPGLFEGEKKYEYAATGKN